MAYNFADAPQEQGGSLIPKDTLAFARLSIEPKASEFGKILHEGRDNPQNKYLKCELEIIAGQYTGRKVFHMLGVHGSDQWVNMSMAAIRHILETGKGAGPSNPQGYVIGVNLPDGDERAWMELDGLTVAIKVGIEKGKDNYPDKNRVAQFLSPNPSSPTHKDFLALQTGQTSAPAARAPAQPSWNTGPAPTQGVPAPPQQGAPPAAPSRPNWTGGAPPQPGGAPLQQGASGAPF